MTTRTRNHQNMNKLLFWSLLVVFALDACLADETVKCYKCAVSVEKYYRDNRTSVTPLCSKFDKSEKYIVDCPYSTMCQRTISTLHLQNGEKRETVTMGCAQQKNTTQVYNKLVRSWGPKYSIEDVYQEGCFEITGYAAASSTHCYCRGDLCNSSVKAKISREALTGILAFYLWRWMSN